MRTRIPRLLTALIVGGLALGAASPAFARTAGSDQTDVAAEVTAADLKIRCIQAIDERFDSLSGVHERLHQSEFVTSEHHRSLDSIIEATESGLRNLRGQIDSSTDREELHRLCSLIGPEYRVYLLVLPQIQLTAAVDRIAAAEGRADELSERFVEAVEEAIAAGADVTDAVRLAAEAMSQIDAAIEGIDGVAEMVLAVTPHGYDEGPGAAALDSARQAVRTSHGQLKSGWETGKAAVQALKDAMTEI